jgi:beta-glucosidase
MFFLKRISLCSIFGSMVLLQCISVTAQSKKIAAKSATRNMQYSERIDDLILKMTLEEKIRMGFGGTEPGVVVLPGVPRLGIPPIKPIDGPRGVTAVHAGTAFPTGVGMAASWSPELFRSVGEVVAEEARASGKTMVLGPAINIERDPLDGRFFEYLTEDPYLDGQLSVGFIQGVQSRRVAAVVKHLCCNNREWNRDWYMSNVDERTMQEIYLPGFEASAAATPGV